MGFEGSKDLVEKVYDVSQGNRNVYRKSLDSDIPYSLSQTLALFGISFFEDAPI